MDNVVIAVITTAMMLMIPALIHSQENSDFGFNEEAPAELSQFGFWLGKWTYETTRPGPDGDVAYTGTNTISVTFSGYGLLEDFHMYNDETEYAGGSVTTIHPQTKEFVQVWTDSSGWSNTFKGKWDEAAQAMILYGPEEKDAEGNLFQTRLVWGQITGKDMLWQYERSEDGGATWVSTWDLHYKRVDEK